MELRSLQYFVRIADEGSITRAAAKLGVAQPALTRHVKQLEVELGTQLLTRLPRGVRLTTPGRDFLEHARKIIVEIGRARDQVHRAGRTPRGKVAVGTSPTLAPLLLPPCIARARQECPTIALKVMEGFSPQLLDALLARCRAGAAGVRAWGRFRPRPCPGACAPRDAPDPARARSRR